MNEYHVALTGDYAIDGRFLRALGYRGDVEGLLERMYAVPHDLRRLKISDYQYRLYKEGKNATAFHRSITLTNVKEPKTFDVVVDEPQRKKKSLDVDQYYTMAADNWAGRTFTI